MRYEILKPPSPIDIRSQAFTSLDALHIVAPFFELQDSEDGAVAAVRSLAPDAVGMPIPINVGSGQIWMMAFVDDEYDARLDPADHIPFILLVRAVAETPRDRLRIGQHAHFDQKKWRPPLHRPVMTGSSVHQVEIRSTDMAGPVRASAVVGVTADGRPVISVDVGGVSMSMMFPRAGGIELAPRRSDGAAKVNRDDVVAAGVSFDPTPH